MQKELLRDKWDDAGLAAPGARPLRKLECSNCSIFKKPRGIGASAWLCEASAAARSSFSFPLRLHRRRLPKVPVPSGWFGDRALAGPSLGTAAAFPSSALQNPARFFLLIAPGLLWGWVSSCPSLRVPGWCWGPAPMAGSSRSKAEAAELKRAQAIKSTRSRWSAQSVSPPPPPPLSSLSSSFLPTPLNLVFADLSPPRTPQPSPKQDPHLPLHPQPLIPPQTEVHSASTELHLLS